MSELVVTGYASLDYPVSLAGTVQPNQTTHIAHRDPSAWPRVGGSPYYVGAAASRAGMDVAPISWTGDDAPAEVFMDACKQAGLSTGGIQSLTGRRSPVCLLLHQSDESTACLFDPAFPGEEKLTNQQITLLENCAHACITVGPGHLIDPILKCVPQSAQIYWVAKNDRAAFPDEALPSLSERSSVIFCNRSERDWVGRNAIGSPIIVETLGAEGCRITQNGHEQFVPTKPMKVRDPTGAGDTFVGGFVHAFSKKTDPVEAAKAGTELAHDMLERRAANE